MGNTDPDGCNTACDQLAYRLTSLVVLVHGTRLPLVRSQALAWTDERSEFRKYLATQIPGVKVDDKFEWNGKNSHIARLEAGAALAQHLRDVHAANPEANIALLAHSHGGTVALYAMAEVGAVDYVSDLILMNTPFLNCQPRNIATYFKAIVGALFSLCIPTMIIMLNAISDIYMQLLVFLLVTSGWLLLKPATEYLTAYQKVMQRKLQPVGSSTRLVYLTCSDEVGTWLGALVFLTNLPFAIWLFVARMGARLVGLAFLGSMLFALLGTLIMVTHRNSIDGSTLMGSFVELVWFGFGGLGELVPITMGITGTFVLLFLIVLFLIPNALHRSAFGFGDKLVQNLLLDIRVQTSPAASGSRRTFVEWKYSGAPFGQRHFAYLYEPAKHYIVRELARPIPFKEAKTIGKNASDLRPCSDISATTACVESAGIAGPITPTPSSGWKAWKDRLLKPCPSIGSVPGRKLLTRLVLGIWVLLVTVFIVHGVHLYRTRDERRLEERQAGMAGVVFTVSPSVSSTDSDRFKSLLNGFQAYLQSIGHPPAWPTISVSIEPTLPKEDGEVDEPSSSWYPGRNGSRIIYSVIARPKPNDVLSDFGQALLKPDDCPILYESSSCNAVVYALSEYLSWSYLGASTPMHPQSAQWPAKQGSSFSYMFAGDSLAQTLWSLRENVGKSQIDKAVMLGFLRTHDLYRDPHYERVFANSTVELLGTADPTVRKIFVQHGVLEP